MHHAASRSRGVRPASTSKRTQKSRPQQKPKRTIKTKKAPLRGAIISTSTPISPPSHPSARPISTSPQASRQPASITPSQRHFKSSLHHFTTHSHAFSTAPEQHTISLERVLHDLQLESLIPTIQAPPELQSLLLHRSKHPEEGLEISLYHLVILSSADFRRLIPNDIQRNRLKEHLRTLLGGPKLHSDDVEPISPEQFNEIVNNFVSSQHLTKTDPVAPVKVDIEAAPQDQATKLTDAISDATVVTTQDPSQPSSQSTDTTATTSTPTEHSTPTDAVHADLDAAAKAEQSLAQETLKISIQPLKMPSFFDGMKAGTIQEWHVKVGAHFTRGQVLCDIDTDIAELSFEAPEPGHLSEILVPAGQTVKVGDAIAVLRYREDED